MVGVGAEIAGALVAVAEALVAVTKALMGVCLILWGWAKDTKEASTSSARLACLVGTLCTVSSLTHHLLRTEGSAVGTRFGPPRSLDRSTSVRHLATTTRVVDLALGADLVLLGMDLLPTGRLDRTAPPLLLPPLTPDHPALKVSACSLSLYKYSLTSLRSF